MDTCHTAPSLRLFVPNSLTMYHRFLLSEVPVHDVTFLDCGFSSFSPRCSVSNKDHRPPPYECSSQATPEKVPSLPSTLFFFYYPWGRCLNITSSLSTRRSFFRFARGRPLRKVQFLIFRNPLDLPVACFRNTSPRAFLANFSDILSILRRSCRLVPGFFIRSLPRSCSLRPRSLMPLLHFEHFQYLILDVRPFGVFGAISSLTFLSSSCSLRRATYAQRDIFLQAAHSFRGPQFPWVPIFPKRFLFHHATLARRDAFLLAAFKPFWDSQLAWILPFGFWRRPAARFRSLRRFLSPPTGITAAYSLGTS
jgi:hypothetical protein